ncbi:MAG: hypothetical protein H8E17_15180 [Deltaproteobacteria bacterium]|nr:hypothetical protein [Deltaproteobacteria bacterium]
MLKKIFIYIPLLIVAVSLFPGCGEKIEPGNVKPGQPLTVKAPVAIAKITSQPFIYEAVGTVTARTASTLSA